MGGDNMKPVLYKANETDFTTLGLGVLADELKTLVTEERNGQFYLEMEYPVDGIHFKELKNNRIIKAHASNKLKNQRFEIIRITKPAKGVVKVYAEHVSNHTSDLQLKPNVSYNGTASQALNTWKNSIVDSHPFTVYSDVTTTGSGKWLLGEVENARQALGGVQGSILDTYGGEYLFDNYRISLLKQRGDDNGLPIMYGKNLIDLEQEEEIASTYTSIFPYSVYTPESEEGQVGETEPVEVTLPEYFIDSEHVDKYSRRKILKVDFTSDEIKSVEELRRRAQRYIIENDIGVPKVNLRVKFIDLAKTLDYKDTAIIEEINLCDWVVVHFEKLGIQQRAKVIKVVWNVGLERYEEIELGETRASLTQSIDRVVDGRIEKVETQVNEIRVSANGKNRNHWGPNEPLPQHSQEGDTWFRPIGNGEEEIYRYNGYMWVFVLSTADTTKNADAIAEQQQEIAETKQKADETAQQIDTAVSSLGFVDLSSALSSFDGQLVTHQETLDGMQSIVYDPERGVASLNTQLADLVQIAVTGEELSNAITVSEQGILGQVVKNDEVIARINASEEGILLQANKIQALGDVVVDGKLTITDKFIAPGITADKITAGKLFGNDVTANGINVNTIVGLNSSFLRTTWNGINTAIQIDPEYIRVYGTKGRKAYITPLAEFRSDAANGKYILMGNGRIQAYAPDVGALFILGSDLYNIKPEGQLGVMHRRRFAIGRYDRYSTDEGTPQLNPYIELGFWKDQSGYRDRNGMIRIHKPIMFEYRDNITGVGTLNAEQLIVANGGYLRPDTSAGKYLSRLALGGSRGISFGVMTTSSYSRKAYIDNTHMYMFVTLSMEGRSITNVGSIGPRSERKYKKHIKPLKRVRDTIMSMNIYSYIKRGEFELGIMADEAPKEVLMPDEKSINLYSYASMLGKGLQEAFEEIDKIREVVAELKGVK